MRASEFIDEDISRRNLLKGVAGAAALGATGLAKAGDYQPHTELIKDKEKLVNVWGPRQEQLQQRCNSMLAKLIRTAGPAWSKQLAGTTITVRSTNQYAAASAEDRTIDIDISVFWDAPDETLAIAIGHELGHIALGHTGTAPSPEQSRKDELNADAFAIKLGKALGYNKAGLFNFMYSKKEDYNYANFRASQSNSSHPNYNQRIDNAKKRGFQLSKGGIQQMNTLLTHLA